MKTTGLSVRVWCLIAALAVVGACSTKKTPDTGTAPTPTPLHVAQIIIQPQAAAPGDTLKFTADIRSSSQNVGDIPKTDWSASGGTFLENNELTVRWQAPTTSGVYDISVKATNAAGSAKQTAQVFVGGTNTLIPEYAGAIHMLSGLTDFYYPSTTDPTTFDNVGTLAYFYSGGSYSPVLDAPFATGPQMVFSPTGTYEVHAKVVISADSTTVVTALKPQQLYITDFATKTLQRITQDLSATDSSRRNQFLNPSVSMDGDFIAYQGMVTNAGTAASDSMDVFVYRRTGPTRVRVTGTHNNHHNYYPTIATDDSWVVFISDRPGANEWELYGAPINGGVVDTDPASVQQLTTSGGTMANGSKPARPLMAWNPVSPTLAIASADGVLYSITMNGGGGSAQEIGVPVPHELRWMANGSMLAVEATGKNSDDKSAEQIYTVGGTTATLRHTANPGDVIGDLAWSPDGAWIVYRLTRGSNSWFELLDINAGHFNEPIPVTAGLPTSNLPAYRAVMSMSPVWGPANILYMLRFTADAPGATPAVMTLDLTGAIQ